jgi:hypothetical protein
MTNQNISERNVFIINILIFVKNVEEEDYANMIRFAVHVKIVAEVRYVFIININNNVKNAEDPQFVSMENVKLDV